MAEVGEAYAATRERITQLVGELGDGEFARPVPACPGWSVKDLLAHLAGVVDDALAGRLDGVATEPWTQAQVETRRDRTVADIVGEWEAKAPQFEAVLDHVGAAGPQAVFDVVTHEHDLRGAVGRPGARDSQALRVALAFAAPALVQSHTGPALRLRAADGQEWVKADAADPVATLTADAFEILRAAAGRRSLQQIRGMAWTGDVDAVLPAFTFGPFAPRDTPLEE